MQQDGTVVREAYYRGTDADTLHDVRSVTKTVMALLVGAAIDSACLTSVDQTIGELLGDRAPVDPAKAAITLRQLLTMTSGFDWNEEGDAGYNVWEVAPDHVAYVISRPLAATPGAVFNYDSGALHLLSVIVTRACAPTPEFAAQHLFAPLGIASRGWEINSEGIANGAAGLELSTADMTTIGQLFLDHGRFDGAQVVSAAYVDLAMTPQVETHLAAEGYGYGMWVEGDVGGRPMSFAQGFGGQFIVVVPRLRAVIAATTDWLDAGSRADSNFRQLLRLIENKIVLLL